ncbi:MAG: DUF2155 domain-containing protein [Tistlia sp.]|uniref:DUF2155 domain-containing protein n=1 Tax=Tistlia sp. TaxID=3057121 RepID=UPI0034A27570
MRGRLHTLAARLAAALPVALLAAVLLLAGPLAVGPAAAQGDAERMTRATSLPFAELQGLDKVTARISRVTVPVGEPVEFGGLTLRVLACWKNPPEETPESAAYLEITDRAGASEVTAFAGWMYASSPAVNGLEHPVYDVWVLDCLSEAPPPEETPPEETPPEDAADGEAAPKG